MKRENYFFFKNFHAQRDWVVFILFFMANEILVLQQIVEGIGAKIEKQGNFEH